MKSQAEKVNQKLKGLTKNRKITWTEIEAQSFFHHATCVAKIRLPNGKIMVTITCLDSSRIKLVFVALTESYGLELESHEVEK